MLYQEHCFLTQIWGRKIMSWNIKTNLSLMKIWFLEMVARAQICLHKDIIKQGLNWAKFLYKKWESRHKSAKVFQVLSYVHHLQEAQEVALDQILWTNYVSIIATEYWNISLYCQEWITKIIIINMWIPYQFITLCWVLIHQFN